MNTKSKDGKKRIAHVGSLSSNTVENAEKHQNDYLASILERMDSNDKQIVSYEQLNDYRKSKNKPVLPDIDVTQPVESSGSFKLKKKLCPLMAKCQRNIKYIKHNRCIPKPRAHVGSLSKETQSVKLPTELKKNIDAKIKPKKVQKNSFELSSEKPSKSLSLQTKAKKPVSSAVKKLNEEWNDKILKSKNGTETNNSSASKNESEARFPVETNSSEESDNFESFIKQQVVSDRAVNRKHTFVKKRRKVQKRKVFKRIKYGNALSSESDADNELKSFSKTALNKSLEANELIKSKDLEGGDHNSDDGSRENSFDFDNACNDSSDNCEENDTLCKTPQVDYLLSKNNKTVEQLVDNLGNSDLSDSCLSSSNAADYSPQLSLPNKESNQSENSLPMDQVSSSKQELSELKKDSEHDEAGGYESDDCVILENSPPEFNIKISAVKSVAMLPTTDEESAEAVLESNSPWKIIDDETNKNECNKMDSEIQIDTLNQPAIMSSLASSRKPRDELSEKNVWEALKAIDFEKLKSLPQLSNSLSKEKIKSEEISSVSIADQIQSSSSLPQEKPCIAHPESSSQNSTSSKKYGVVELIELSDDEDTSRNEIVESTNQNLDFISPTVPTVGSTSSICQNDLFISSKYFNIEVKTEDVSSSGVLDENDLNFHNSLISHNTFPLKQEAASVNIPVVKKEAPCTSDELDISSASSLQTLYSGHESDVCKLLDLYHKEYQQYKEIEKTGLNLSDGLNLLLNKQVDKLVHIKTSIKNIIKHDPCFQKVSKKVKPELKPINCDAIVKKEQDWEKKTKYSSEVSENPQFSDREHPELSIYTESVLQGIQKVVGNSLPPESSLRAEKVKEQLRNVKCAQCGRTASAACQGCFKVFYCSIECGMSDWEKGHSFSCGT